MPRVQPPVVCRWLIRLASWIVPGHSRREWHAIWRSGVESWWILVQRGELIQEANAEFVRHCFCAFADAVLCRFSRESLYRFVHGPSLVLSSAAAILLLVGLATRGFHNVRFLIRLVRYGPDSAPMYLPQDVIVSHTVPLALAIALAVVLVVRRRPALHLYGCRYWSFFTAKTLAIVVIVPILWIEGAALFRSLMAPGAFRILVTGLLFRIVFVISFSCAVLWSFSDQRRRCPVCLQHLGLPVTIGNWSSVFEPVRTEMLCERGHGLLCITEIDDGEEDDRWTRLDESWQELFASR